MLNISLEILAWLVAILYIYSFSCEWKVANEDGGKMVDKTHFRSLVGNLLYLTATRPNIMFAASLLVRFMHYPSHLHLGVAKRVLRYLQGTVELGIKYFRNIEVKLIGHCDSDWGGCIDDMKSTSGHSLLVQVLYLGSQKSKAQWLNHLLKQSIFQLHWQLFKPYGWEEF